MMDNSTKLSEIITLAEQGKYFVINRPRQYGKTTTLRMTEQLLQKREDFLCIRLSFEIVAGQESFEAFVKMFWARLLRYTEFNLPQLQGFIKSLQPTVTDMQDLSYAITKLVHEAQKKIVLLIDEVDANSNYLSFLAFLAMLRDKFLNRKEPQDFTFHSVVLAGVHDIKSLKYKLRNPEEAKYNSPWNIATDFEVEMAFNPREIEPMLKEYSAVEGVEMEVAAIAEHLYYYTSGYPFLVSHLCKIIAEKILPKRSEDFKHRKFWTLEDVEQAVQLLLKETNTNFDSLTSKIENNPNLYRLVYEVIIKGTIIPFNPHEPVTRLGRMYGIFKENGRVKIHNRVYEQLLYRYLTSKKIQSLIEQDQYDFVEQYQMKDGGLDLVRVLKKFQQFIKEQKSQKDASFLEREWRLLFLAFLKPIINGKGYDFKEVEISEERRLDIVITYHTYKYIIELKLWRGEKRHEQGLDQLANYLAIHSAPEGYLIIFDQRQDKNWEAKWVEHKGKKIFAVWV
ncbi:MAG: AAA family ATPase [Bacteroidota bacterium]